MGCVSSLSLIIPSHLPSFIRRPPRDNGMPVFFDTRRFALVTPSARFHENIENWIESWVSELEEAVEIFFGP